MGLDLARILDTRRGLGPTLFLTWGVPWSRSYKKSPVKIPIQVLALGRSVLAKFDFITIAKISEQLQASTIFSTS